MSKASEEDRQPEPKLADEGWKRVQRKTFTGWCNYHLKKRDLHIDDIESGFSDGVMLVNLLEVISEEKIGIPHKAPKSRPQKLDNLVKPVKFINAFCKDIGIRLTFSGDQIVDGTNMLGLIWIFILRYSVGDISEEDKSAKEGLLLWVRKVLKPYDVPMDNFTRHWQDGKAFNGLIHRFHSDWVDNPNDLDKANAVANCDKAFDVAEEKLSIPKLLDATDLQEFPDEKSVITYVSFYWKAFAADNATLKAGTNLSKFFNRLKAQKAMQEDYEYRADELAKWMDAKTTFFDAKDVGNSYEEAQAKMKDFQEGYKVSEKPPKGADRVRLEVALANINNRIANEGGPPYNPPEGLDTKGLNDRWGKMLQAEEEYEKALREAMMRKKKIQAWLGRFDQKCKLLNNWSDEKKSYLEDGTLGDSLYDTEGLLKRLDTYDEEFKAYDARYETVTKLGDQIIGEDSTTTDYVTSKRDAVLAARDALPPMAAAKREALNNRVAELKAAEERKVAFAKATEVFKLWVEDITEALTDPVKCDHVAEVEELQAAMPALEAQVAEKEAVAAQIAADEGSIIGTNPYTRYSAADVQSQYESVKAEVANRQAAIAKEAELQASREELRKAFAEKIAAVGAFIEATTGKLQGVSGGLEEQKTQCQAILDGLAEGSALLEAAKQADDQCHEADITDNVHTHQSYPEAQVTFLQLGDSIREKLSGIERDIIKGNTPALTEEQLEEFRQVFNHFDKDKSNTLEFHEFKACLASLGEDFDEAELQEQFKTLAEAGGGTKVDFQAFTGFMAERNREATSKDDIVAAFKAFAPQGGIPESALDDVLDKPTAEFAKSLMTKNADGTYDFEQLIAVLNK